MSPEGRNVSSPQLWEHSRHLVPCECVPSAGAGYLRGSPCFLVSHGRKQPWRSPGPWLWSVPKQRVNSDVADAGSARSPYTENTFCSCYNLLFFSFMCKGVLSSCMFEHHVCTQCLWRLEEGVRSTLELQMLANRHMGVGNYTQVLWKSSLYS